MYKKNHLFDTPPDDIMVWRYMDLAKFISLLEDECLFLSRADKFEDPYEGLWPTKNIEVYSNASLSKSHKELKKHVLINCWHINEYESDAMWKIYSQNQQGIAIQSTVGKIKGSILCDMDIYIGKVKYIDFNEDFIEFPPNPIKTGKGVYYGTSGEFFSAFLNKRKSFAHEKELRIVSDTLKIKRKGKEGVIKINEEIVPTGINIKVSLIDLIEKIYLSPICPSWYFELIGKILKRYELDNIPLIQSEILKLPIDHKYM